MPALPGKAFVPKLEETLPASKCSLRGSGLPEHLTPRYQPSRSPRARGASCPLRHSRGGPAHLQACHPGGVTKDELEFTAPGSPPPGPTGTVGRATEGGGHSSALPGGLWGCSPELSPTFLGTGTQIFTDVWHGCAVT